MKKHVLALALLMGTCAQAQVYQCVINGRKVFADKPCDDGAKPMNIAPPARPAPPTDAAKEAPADLTKRADLAVKKRLLDDEIYRKEQRVKSTRAEMESKLATLREKKRDAANNLAGATWENSISQEMNSVVSAYDGQIRSIESEINSLRAQRTALDK